MKVKLFYTKVEVIDIELTDEELYLLKKYNDIAEPIFLFQTQGVELPLDLKSNYETKVEEARQLQQVLRELFSKHISNECQLHNFIWETEDLKFETVLERIRTWRLSTSSGTGSQIIDVNQDARESALQNGMLREKGIPEK
jgi:hypothetical protein